MKTNSIYLKTLIILLVCVTNFAKAQQWGDYTLYSIMNSTTTTLLDTNSGVYHTWNHGTKQTGYSSYLLPGGTLLRTAKATGVSFTGGPICGEVQKVDWSGTVTWDYVYSTTSYCTHHDICPMPNGNVLLIAYERKTAAEVTAAGCTSFALESWPERIVEVQPTGATTGTVVWEWHAWDHLLQSTSSALANYQTSVVNHPELLNVNLMTMKDWMHMNGVNYNPYLDQITFSCHNLSEMFVIDHSTTSAEAAGHTGGNAGKGGDLLYRWGHPSNYGAAGTAILNVVHDAHFIPEGVPNAGRLVGFNNNGISASQSAVDEFMPPYNSSYNYNLTLGSAYTPATYDYRLACSGHTSNMGNSQQLPNGNMMVCVALSGLIYEVNSAGTTLWSYTATGSVPKAYRYSNCYITNAAPAIPAITEATGTLSATSAATYQWYMNGVLLAGETNQTYTPAASGIYVVRITDVNGCVYEYSSGYHYTMTVGDISYNDNERYVSLYPNPTTGIFTIESSKYEVQSIKIMNVLGEFVYKADSENLNTEINITDLPNGIYFVSITSPTLGVINKKINLIK